jgi:NhaP-type Na+/H+ or K+/H+ antiporter
MRSDQLGLYLVLLGEETLQMQLPLPDPVSIGRPAPRSAPRGVLGQHLAQLLEINTYSTSLAGEMVMVVVVTMMMMTMIIIMTMITVMVMQKKVISLALRIH